MGSRCSKSREARPRNTHQDADVDTDAAGKEVDNPASEEMNLPAPQEVDVPAGLDSSVQGENSNAVGAAQELRWIDLGELIFIRHIGEGGFGIVDEYEWKGRRVAVKTLTWKGRAILEREAALLTRVQRHPNVVEFLGCVFNEKQKKGMLVMELGSQDLRSFLDSCPRGGAPFSRNVSLDMMRQLANGLLHLRQRRVLHRDLKSLNILVNPRPRNISSSELYYDLKLLDFGRSKCNMQDSLFSSVVAPRRWRAPEVFKDEDVISTKYTWSSDVYSFAMVCYEILSGDMPFQEVDSKELREAVCDDHERPELPANCPRDLLELIHECWETDPIKRPDIVNVHQRLSTMAL